MGKYLSKKIGILKSSGIVFSECRKMRHLIQHIQTKKPPVGNIYLDFLTGLSHAFDPIEILNKRNLDQHHGIHTGTAIVRRIFFGYKVINKVPVNGFIYDSKKVVLWNHVIHAKELHLPAFFICILSHHNWNLLP